MSAAGTALAKLQIKPGDIVVVQETAPDHGEEVMLFVKQLAGVETVGENHVVILPFGVSVESLDEAGMAERGWFRKEALPQC